MSAHTRSGEAHGTRRGYLLGFAMSVVLTAVPFALAMLGAVDKRTTALLAMAAALLQIVVHMVFFLHMNTKSQGGWTFMALAFTAVLVVITLSGSLWVMHNLDANMMPGMARMESMG